MLFNDNQAMETDSEVVASEEVDWLSWSRDHGILDFADETVLATIPPLTRFEGGGQHSVKLDCNPYCDRPLLAISRHLSASLYMVSKYGRNGPPYLSC